MTPEPAIRLAEVCLSLHEACLREASIATDTVLLAFFKCYPKLHTLQVTGRNSSSGSLFDHLAAHPEVVPKLKALQFTSNTDKGFLRSMKALMTARIRMEVTLRTQHELIN